MCTWNSHKDASDLEGKYIFLKIKSFYVILFSLLNEYQKSCLVYIWYYNLGIFDRVYSR